MAAAATMIVPPAPPRHLDSDDALLSRSASLDRGLEEGDDLPDQARQPREGHRLIGTETLTPDRTQPQERVADRRDVPEHRRQIGELGFLQRGSDTAGIRVLLVLAGTQLAQGDELATEHHRPQPLAREHRSVLQRQDDGGVFVEPLQGDFAHDEVAIFGPGMDLLPIVAEEACDQPEAGGEAGYVAIEQAELAGEHKAAQIAALFQNLAEIAEGCRKIDRAAVKGNLPPIVLATKIRGWQRHFQAPQHIHEIRIGIRIGTTGIVGRNRLRQVSEIKRSHAPSPSVE